MAWVLSGDTRLSWGRAYRRIFYRKILGLKVFPYLCHPENGMALAFVGSSSLQDCVTAVKKGSGEKQKFRPL
jgi:hypothetical protein